MTSMLLTTSSACVVARSCALFIEALKEGRHAAGAWSRALAACGVGCGSTFLSAIARCNLLFCGVLGCALLDHVMHHRTVPRHESGQSVELLAIPLLELHHARPLVIRAAGLDGWEQTGGAKFLQARLAQINMLESPAHLLGSHYLALAEIGLGLADCLDDHDPVSDPPRVIDRAYARLVLQVALTGPIDFLHDLLHYREVRTVGRKRGGDVALRRIASRNNILLGACPPYAQNMVARKAELGCGLEGDRIHDTVAPKDDVIGTQLPDLQPLRFLRVARGRNRYLGKVEAVTRRERIEDWDRLLAVRGIV